MNLGKHNKYRNFKQKKNKTDSKKYTQLKNKE